MNVYIYQTFIDLLTGMFEFFILLLCYSYSTSSQNGCAPSIQEVCFTKNDGNRLLQLYYNWGKLFLDILWDWEGPVFGKVLSRHWVIHTTRRYFWQWDTSLQVFNYQGGHVPTRTFNTCWLGTTKEIMMPRSSQHGVT